MDELEIPISFGNGLDADTLRGDFVSVTVHPPEASDLAFRIALPRSWTEVANVAGDAVSEDEFTPLAIFQQSDDLNVQVFGTLIPFEVNLTDWLGYQSEVREFENLQTVSGDTDNGQTVHATAEAADGASLRLMVTGKGPHVVLLVGSRPADDPASNEVLGLAAASFDFLVPPAELSREPLVPFIDPSGLFRLLYPKSWTPAVESSLLPHKSGSTFRIESATDTLALLRVEADTRLPLDGSGLEKAFTIAIQEVEESGIVIGDLEPIPADRWAADRERWVGPCSLPSGEGQIALLFRNVGLAWASTIVICPGPNIHPMAWLRAKRAYEIAVATLAPCGLKAGTESGSPEDSSILR